MWGARGAEAMCLRHFRQEMPRPVHGHDQGGVLVVSSRGLVDSGVLWATPLHPAFFMF